MSWIWGTARTGRLYDISAIDFERLRQEFAKNTQKNTQVQNLKNAIEKRLALMLAQNPLRTNFQQRYENLIAEYNREKDRPTIEKTFETLLKLVADLDEEKERSVREGLDESTLAVFDLLKKDDLAPGEIKHIKTVAVDLYARLEAEGWSAFETGRTGKRPETASSKPSSTFSIATRRDYPLLTLMPRSPKSRTWSLDIFSTTSNTEWRWLHCDSPRAVGCNWTMRIREVNEAAVSAVGLLLVAYPMNALHTFFRHRAFPIFFHPCADSVHVQRVVLQNKSN